jgi:hypothetical protein
LRDLDFSASSEALTSGSDRLHQRTPIFRSDVTGSVRGADGLACTAPVEEFEDCRFQSLVDVSSPHVSHNREFWVPHISLVFREMWDYQGA